MVRSLMEVFATIMVHVKQFTAVPMAKNKASPWVNQGLQTCAFPRAAASLLPVCKLHIFIWRNFEGPKFSFIYLYLLFTSKMLRSGISLLRAFRKEKNRRDIFAPSLMYPVWRPLRETINI